MRCTRLRPPASSTATESSVVLFHVSWCKGAEEVFADVLYLTPLDIPTPEEEFGESAALSCRTPRVCLQSQESQSPPFNLRFKASRRSSFRWGLPAARRIRSIWFSAVHARCTSIPPSLLEWSLAPQPGQWHCDERLPQCGTGISPRDRPRRSSCQGLARTKSHAPDRVLAQHHRRHGGTRPLLPELQDPSGIASQRASAE